MSFLKSGGTALSVLVTLALLGACAQKGSMQGTVKGPGPGMGATVVMNWSSPEGERVQGTLNVMMPNGETYTGPYVQVTDGTQDAELTPYWSGWPDQNWRSWSGGGDADIENGSDENNSRFQVLYGNKVIANLDGDQGGQMRCRFTLMDAVAGMAGGGQGECQLDDGEEVKAKFAPEPS